MFKHTVTYVDFNNKPHTEDIYFHMMVPEFADLEFNPTFDGSLSEYIKQTMRTSEGQKIFILFKMLVVNSYGRRTEDGARFIKKPEYSEEFLNSLAWEQFFLWLTDDPKNAEAFWNGIFPEAMRDKVESLEGEQTALGKKNVSDLSREELEALFLAKIGEKKPANEITA